MMSFDDLLKIIKGVAARGEAIDVCVSCDWCDTGHTFVVTGADIDGNKLHIEGNDEDDVWIKNIEQSEITTDSFGREFHITQPVGLDWMISLV